MKPRFALFAFSVAASAGPILVTDPISLTGSGTWSFSFIGGEMIQSASASGNNGADSAGFSYISDCAGAGGPSVEVSVNGGCAVATGMGAEIDDVFSSLFSIQLGAGGTGLLELYDSNHDLLASADVIGWINVTTLVYNGPPGDPGMSGDGAFAIAAVPEPPTWLPLLLGMAWLIKRRPTAGAVRFEEHARAVYPKRPETASCHANSRNWSRRPDTRCWPA
jgi:hypothetical protein